MESVALVIDPVVKFLMVTIMKHVGFFVCSTKNVKALDAKKKQLNETAEDMKDKKGRADANQKVVSKHVSPWIKDVEKLIEDAENIQPAGIGCFNVAKRYKAGKQSFDILKKLNDLETRASKIEWTNEIIPLGMVVTSTSTSTSATTNHDGTPTRFESRQLIVNDALKFLGSNDETNKMMALSGMGGVGKTTMMEQLRKVVIDSKMFDWVVKVVIGQNTDLVALQKAIADYMGGEPLTETSKEARADRLHEKFMGMSNDGEKKILVLMDDLWNEVDLEDFGLKSPLPKGLKLLFTSRFEDVCSRMGVKTDSIFKVGILNDAEAKGLFFGIMDPSISKGDNPELQKIGVDIVSKCRGLPIAIVTIAKSLKDDIKEAWEAVRSHLEDDNLKDIDSIVKKIFEMSYDNLKKDLDKAIFLLSGLFPDDFDILTEDLLRYGWGLGFFKDVKTLATARRDMKICVNNLIRANLLTESDEEGCVKMHDLVRAFILSNFSKVKQASIVNHDNMSVGLTEDANDSYERILLNCKGMSEFPTGFNYPNLSVLMLINGNDHLKFPQDFYERMEKLEVVSYGSIPTPLLPVTFENATKLRTLCLRSCSLMYDLSFLGNLSNLETLSFANCKVRKLPSTIGKLKKLKLLDLSGCVSLRIDDGVFENLVSLEELYLRSSTGYPIEFTDANCKELGKLSNRLHALDLVFFENAVQPKNVSFKKLERFSIYIGCELKYHYQPMYPFKNTLDLHTSCNELLECKISGLFDKTEVLRLDVIDMNRIEDVSVNESFSNLRVLQFEYCKELTYLFTIPVANGLKQLTQLSVVRCPVLKALVGGDDSGVEVIKFPELKFINLICLPELMYPFTIPVPNGLKKLTSLDVCKCPVLKALVGGDDSGVEAIKFPELKFISLRDLPKLISLSDSSYNVIELPKVVKLELSDLPNFTSIFPDSSNTEAMQSVLSKEVPNLEILHIENMKNLEQIWPCQMPTAEKNNGSMVKEIRVKKCHNLVNLFPSNPLPLLNRLEHLYVEKCSSIEVLFNLELVHVCEMEEYISRLRKIEVKGLGKLRELWRMKGVDNSDILIKGFKCVEPRSIISCLGKQRELWRMKGVDNSDILIKSFKGVESISVTNCYEFKYIFTPTTTYFDLGAITSFSTRNFYSPVRNEEMDDNIPNFSYTSQLLHTCPPIQKLQIDGDEKVEVVFDMDSPSSSTQLSTNQQPPLLLHPYLQVLTLSKMQNMSHVWKCNWNKFLIPQQPPHKIPFHNLTNIYLYMCGKIKYLLSPLMAKSLSSLQEVQIENCESIEEVISSRDDEKATSTFTSSHTSVALFPHLDTLLLGNLECLKRIDGGDASSRSDKISFSTTTSIHDQFQSAQVTSGSWSLCQYPRKIVLEVCPVFSSLIPGYAVGQLKNLEELSISNSGTIIEIFESQTINNITEVEALEIKTINDSGFIESQTVVKIPNLRQVDLQLLDGLKYLSKSNQRMVIEFPKLTRVRISECRSFEHVFTCSMVGSLVHLQDLHIEHCEKITEIVKEEEEEVCDAKVNDIITLPRLKSLILTNLKSLKGFCLGKEAFSWPSLNTLIIDECPAITVFTKGHLDTPKLKEIGTTFGVCEVSEDVNSFINTKQEEGYQF